LSELFPSWFRRGAGGGQASVARTSAVCPRLFGTGCHLRDTGVPRCSHSRESGNLLRKPLEMRRRRTGFPLPAFAGTSFAGMTSVSKGIPFPMAPAPPFRASRATGVVECPHIVVEGVKKWVPSPQRRRDAEKGPFVFKPLRLRDSAVRRVFGDYFTASRAVGYDLSPAARAGARRRGHT
jgi:hypothetical protein